MDNNQTKSKKRVADHGEVFTAEREVNAMLDLVKDQSENIESRFLEPACGTGNFLAEILRRKLSTAKRKYGKNPDDYERYAVIAVTSIYGVDILQDNVYECRERMFEIFDKAYRSNCKKTHNEETREAVRFILCHNILCGDALWMKKVDAGGKILEDEPIIFAEWGAVNSCMIKRRDYRLDHMLKRNEENEQMSIGKDATAYEYDKAGNIILKPVKEYEPISYKKIQQAKESKQHE